MVEEYAARIERGELPTLRGHVLDREDLVLRRHILNLMTRFTTDWSAPELSVPYLDTVHERLTEMNSDGLVRLNEQACSITEAGRPFLRNICMAFDARLARKDAGLKLFSRTI